MLGEWQPGGLNCLVRILKKRQDKSSDCRLRRKLEKLEKIWSGRRDLNSRLRPWQGRTLPLSYSRSLSTAEFLADAR